MMPSQSQMSSFRKATHGSWLLSAVLAVIALSAPAFAQVNPAEIANPRLKAAQIAYFPQIKTLYKQINDAKFPFKFALGRYVGIDPGRQPESDARGIEFVFFHERMLLKISGSYNAAYRADLLTQNQRASRAFSEVIEPAAVLAAGTIPADVDCDGIGFEISFHVRTRTKNFDFEGKEILVVVLDRAALSAFAHAPSDAQRQEILNRSEVYLDGKQFGLALNEKDPIDLETLDHPLPVPAQPARNTATAASYSHPDSRLVNPHLLPPELRPRDHFEIAGIPTGKPQASQPASVNVSPAPVIPTVDPAATVTATDADYLQTQYQLQLDVLAKLGLEKFHFVNYAPPSFVIYRNQVMLQLTLRNTAHFSQDSTSLYKRAAQSFDLFLAGQLKDILDKIPADAPFAGFDITVVNQFGTDAHSSSEAIEFICPRIALRRFVDADITNQQLIDQSIVLVNGVRIALTLQLVE
jgi:hypothetical protein